MKKTLICFILLTISALQSVAEQYLLQCPMTMTAINTANGSILTKTQMQRFFIIDTTLEAVYDSDNLPLDVEGFSDENIVFRHKAANFHTIVETKITYNRVTKKITLTEIYANNAYSNRAQFATKGEGTCTEKEIERKPIFYY